MILAVAGGAGGVGTSTVAFALADELGAVCVDGDLAMADLPESRGPDLHDVLADRADPVEAVDESGPVALLACGRTLAGAAACDPDRLADTLRAVEREYGVVVVDCPAGLGRVVGELLAAADSVVLTTRPTEGALAHADRVRTLARGLDTGLVAVAVCRASDTDEARERFGAPSVAVPESETVRRATHLGRPVTTHAPDSRAAKGMTELASVVRQTHTAVGRGN
ncbi:chromosome partitioning protein ParA [Halosegnis longus]|uniref:Chromosome partitioning protein ParA n=1 Tax=Halosegnis longus TaxID=2216012 RepID=A0AAJ4UWQ5_9EURY|nr:MULTISPECIES: chromosome partitioning protein ParA [Halobacteriales]RNJ27323.1 chromosome partitioning protein ParA [Salella cibi]